METIKEEKVRKFEEFVDRRLKPDLVHAIATRDKVFEQQKIFSDLRNSIENLEKNRVTNLRTLVNLGSEVYMQADVPDTTHIFVDVGLGFHVEFTWSEALNYISAREEKLARQIEEHTRLIASIKAQIKMVWINYSPFLLPIKHVIRREFSDTCIILSRERWTRWFLYVALMMHFYEITGMQVCEGIRELLQLASEPAY